MLVKNLSCPNQENTNYTYRLPSNTRCASDALGMNFFIGPCDNTANKSNKCSKDLKCEIDDKTKNELKKNIKGELEKDLKCEIDDETKNELKDKIKKEMKDEIDCKCDQDKTLDEEKDKDEIADDGSEGAIKSMLITEKHAVDKDNCSSYAGNYKSYGEVGKPGWFTKDLLKQFLPDLMSKKEIVDHFYTKDLKQYHADNFAITFKCEEDTKCGNKMNFTWGGPSSMWCNKEGKTGMLGNVQKSVSSRKKVIN